MSQWHSSQFSAFTFQNFIIVIDIVLCSTYSSKGIFCSCPHGPQFSRVTHLPCPPSHNGQLFYLPYDRQLAPTFCTPYASMRQHATRSPTLEERVPSRRHQLPLAKLIYPNISASRARLALNSTQPDCAHRRDHFAPGCNGE